MSATAVQSAPSQEAAPALHRDYRADIDGLRAIAILSVVLHHAGVPFLPGGFTGVDIFFVLSGYLIGGQIYMEVRSGAFSYLLFYRRRVRRILPAFYTVLVFSIVAALVLLSPLEARVFARDALAATLSASNIIFWHFTDYFSSAGGLQPLLMTWSLGVEEQFYLVIPLAMALLGRAHRRFALPAILIVCALSLMLAVRDAGFRPMQAFYLLPDRAWELGAGVALAVFEIDRIAGQKAAAAPAHPVNAAAVAGLAAVLAPLVLLTPQSTFPGFSALPSVMGTAALIALPGSLISRRILSLPPLVFIGQVSYSWYLWHWPMLAFARIATAGNLPPASGLLVAALSFPIAILSWRFVEQPFRRSTRPAGALLRRYALAALVLLAVCAALWSAHGFPQRYAQLAAMEAPASALAADPCLAASQDAPNLSARCYPPAEADAERALPAAPAVALWGDSHAAALAPGLRLKARASGYVLAELTKNSCTPLIGATHVVPRLPALAAGCAEFNQATLRLIQADPRIRIVVLAASWPAPLERTWMDGWLAAAPGAALDSGVHSGSDAIAGARAESNGNRLDRFYDRPAMRGGDGNLEIYRSALGATIRALNAAGKHVILIDDVPSFAIDPLLAVRTSLIPARAALARLFSPAAAPEPLDTGFAPPQASAAIAGSQALLRSAASEFSATLFDPKPAICPLPGQCAYRDGAALLYIDSSHLSAAGAARALAAFPLAPAGHSSK